MKTNPFLVAVIGLILLIACKKDRFTTTPQLKIKSISTDVVPVNGSISFTIQFTDKEGDVKDTLFVKKVRLNKKIVPTIRDSFSYVIPGFPDTKKGDFIVDMNYATIYSAITPPNIPGTNPPQKESDTLLVKFVARDADGHFSDTVTSKQIIVLRN
jgi:hypothetical protein